MKSAALGRISVSSKTGCSSAVGASTEWERTVAGSARSLHGVQHPARHLWVEYGAARRQGFDHAWGCPACLYPKRGRSPFRAKGRACRAATTPRLTGADGVSGPKETPAG